jgi:hypothetical protein
VKQTGFITPLQVEAVDYRNWALLSDLAWNGTRGDTFLVPAGTTTDFASTPWFAYFILPPVGHWTKAAVLHDKMCEELNAIYALNKSGDAGVLLTPTFTAVDTDAIFRKNARDGGTDPVRAELLWMGVRIGALRNPARRAGSLGTAPRVIADVVFSPRRPLPHHLRNPLGSTHMTDIPCPCEGEHVSREWHKNRDLPICDAVRKHRAKVQRERIQRRRIGPAVPQTKKPYLPATNMRLPWNPGTSILVPEIDPL